MEINVVSPGLKYLGNTVRKLTINNSIVTVSKDDKRSFGLEVKKPKYEIVNDKKSGCIEIEFHVLIEQSVANKCEIDITLEGAFQGENVSEDEFRKLVELNGVAALISIARGKIESITANVFEHGKVTIPFINVIDYYKSL